MSGVAALVGLTFSGVLLTRFSETHSIFGISSVGRLSSGAGNFYFFRGSRKAELTKLACSTWKRSEK